MVMFQGVGIDVGCCEGLFKALEMILDVVRLWLGVESRWYMVGG